MIRLIPILICTLVLYSCSQPKSEPKNESKSDLGEKAIEFEFHGNYLPTREFKIHNHLLNSFEIVTNDSLTGNKIEVLFIRFTNQETDEYYVIRDTKNEGSKDKFSISASDPVIGQIQISGSFIGKLGPMNDKIKDPATIVFKGTISADGINADKIECQYFEGD